jgi:hypothetical protein
MLEQNNLELVETSTIFDGHFQVVTWPESQNLMQYDWFENECFLINSERGLNTFGSGAYFVPVNRLIEIMPDIL